MRPKESTLAKLTDYQIRGLAGLLGFTGALKGLTKFELPAAFLAALDERCGGEIPDHIWKIGRTRTLKDSMTSLRQRVAEAARELGEDPAESGFGMATLTVGATRRSPTPQGVSAGGRSRPLGRGRAGKATAMALANDDEESDLDEVGPPPPSGADPRTVLGGETTACLQALARDLKDVHQVLVQVRNLASGTC